MVAFAALPAADRLTQLPIWPAVGSHYVRQFVEAGVFTLADAVPIG